MAAAADAPTLEDVDTLERTLAAREAAASARGAAVNTREEVGRGSG
jgi:hypothetical protein